MTVHLVGKCVSKNKKVLIQSLVFKRSTFFHGKRKKKLAARIGTTQVAHRDDKMSLFRWVICMFLSAFS